MSYRVEFTELDALGNEIKAHCDSLLEEIERIKTATDELINNNQFEGQYAKAVKQYLSTNGVYGQIINAFNEIINAHRDNYTVYKALYMSAIDSGDASLDAVIPEDDILEIREQLLTYSGQAKGYADNIVNALNGVSDIYTNSLSSDVSNLVFYASYDANTLSENIETLNQNINAFEQTHSEQDFIYTAEAIRTLKAFIQGKIDCDGSYKENYTPLINDVDKNALTDSINLLEGVQEANTELIEGATAFDENRVDYFERLDQAERARIITTVATIGVSIGSIAIIVVSGGTATPLVVAGVSAICGAASAGVNEGINQYVVSGDIMPTDWGAVGSSAFVGGATGFVTGYLGGAISEGATTWLSSGAANAFVNSGNTAVRFASNAAIGSASETGWLAHA